MFFLKQYIPPRGKVKAKSEEKTKSVRRIAIFPFHSG